MACPQLQVMQRRCQERAYDSSSRPALRQAHARSSDRTSGYETGADVYLTKPTNVHELEAVIQNLARRRLCVYLTLNEAHLLHDLTTAPERQLGTDDLIRRLSQEHTANAARPPHCADQPPAQQDRRRAAPEGHHQGRARLRLQADGTLRGGIAHPAPLPDAGSPCPLATLAVLPIPRVRQQVRFCRLPLLLPPR